MFVYVLSALFAFGFTYAAAGPVKKLALRFGALDQPNPRKIHETPVPRWGGLALLPGMAAGILAAYFGSPSFRTALSGIHKELWGTAGACLLMIGIGAIDDVRPVPAKLKLTAQLAASAWLVACGVRISFITNPFSHRLLFLNSGIAIFLSLFWIIGITNALNLLDGLDGLLAGVSTISGTALFVIALGKGHVFPAFILLAMSASTLAFLRFNFYPAQIFLGDTGSLFLGILWASLSIQGAFKVSTVTVLAPLLILGVPIADTVFTVVRRAGQGRSIFRPDKEHFHHRLVNLGWSQKKTVMAFYAAAGVLGVAALILDRWL